MDKHKRIMDVIAGVSIIVFPIMMLIGFLLHRDLMSFVIVTTAEQLVENFRHNWMFHYGHLVVTLAIPFIILASMYIMNTLKNKGLWYGIIGGLIAVFGSVMLALDKGSLCLVLAGFDTLPDAQFSGLVPYLQVIVDKAGLLWINWLFALLPLGFIIQTIGLIKEQQVKVLQGSSIIFGLLLLYNPDIEIISVVGAIFMIIGLVPLGVKILKQSPGT